jgi:phosphoglycerate dehydrogenase-like enzyme
MAEPLVVALLYPPDFDADLVREYLKDCPRPVEVIVGTYDDGWELRIAKDKRLPRSEWEHLIPSIDAETRAIFARAEVILSIDVPVDLVELAPRLKVVQGTGAGVAHLDVPWLAKHGIKVAHAAGVQAAPIAEFAIARILEVWKSIRRYEDDQRNRVWERFQSRLFAGSTLGIVGLGAIGSAIAHRAKAFDVRVLATRRSYQKGMTATDVDELMGHEDLDRLLGEADTVVLSAPATPETTDMMSTHQFAVMKKGAIICNIARGALIDETALIEALQAGHLGAAILDVTKDEPLPKDSPLWDAPNVYLSPHSSSSPDGQMQRLARLLADNVIRHAKGEPLINERDPKAGY